MEQLIGIDEDLTDFVIGCDPGPEHCALALVGVNRSLHTLEVSSLEYPRWESFLERRPAFSAKVTPFQGSVSFAYEKVTTRFGSCPGATTYDTCRNSGVALSYFATRGTVERAYALGTVDWRVALGGRTNLSDAEVRQALIGVLGKGQDSLIAALAKQLKKCYNLDRPIGCHLRDAVGVAVGAYLMKRHGTPVGAREVWHG